MDNDLPPPKQTRLARIFVGLGVLWLLLALVLLLFQLSHPTVEVRWETATELNTAGFNLYRSESPQGEFLQINDVSGLIPSEGDPVTGAEYTYTDATVEVGKTYYYLLEEVEFNANRERYNDDILSYQVPYLTSATVLATAILSLIGLALLVTGLKEDREL